jgi:glyoxylase-like metal-dependent hydrolase (beta-lactamase superfamily II)
MQTTRRGMLIGSTAAAALAATGQLTASSPSLAATPPTGKQAPGVYRHKLGDLELTQISDGNVTFPLADGFVTNADKAAVNAALEAAFLPRDQVTIIFNPMVVNNGSKLVLIDTGYGAAGPKTAGQLVTNMGAAGIDPKTIDIVVISHLHPDHINGLVGADGGIAFPNAEIKMPAKEVAYWMDDGNMSRAPAGRMADYFKNVRRVMGVVSSKVTNYEWDKEVAPGITAIPTVGHTPGHTSFVIASGSARLLVQSDVTNHPALFVRNPGWSAVFDLDGPQAIETRRKFYDMAVAEKTLIAGFHYPFPSLGHVEKDGTSYRLVPIVWNPSI